MKTRTATILLLALLLCAADVFAQGGVLWNFVGTGARARGMGGAFIGVADDATAISWNPAGLAALEKPEASFVGFFAAENFKYNDTYDIYDATNDQLVGDGEIDVSSSQSHFSFSFGSFALPLAASGQNFVVAAAYQRLVDLYSLYEDSTYKSEFKGGVDAISPGVGVQITPEIALGAAFNIWTGNRDWEYVNKVTDWDTTVTDLNKFSGFNINFGALASYQKFKFGAVVRTPLTLTDEYKYGDETYKEKFKFPMTFGFGISAAPNENLTLAADVDIRPYSNTDIEDVEDDTTYSAEYENATQFRVGLEYLVIGETTIFPIRLGFHTDPLLNKIYEKNWSWNYITAGFGMIFGNVWIDAAYEYGWLNIDHAYSGEPDLSGNYYFNGTIDQKQTTHNVLVSAIVHFD